jgi:hypothetical protein
MPGQKCTTPASFVCGKSITRLLHRSKQPIYFISLRASRVRTQLSPPPFQLVDLAPSCKARGFFLCGTDGQISRDATLVARAEKGSCSGCPGCRRCCLGPVVRHAVRCGRRVDQQLLVSRAPGSRRPRANLTKSPQANALARADSLRPATTGSVRVKAVRPWPSRATTRAAWASAARRTWVAAWLRASGSKPASATTTAASGVCVVRPPLDGEPVGWLR